MMSDLREYTNEELHRMRILSKQYPTAQAAISEIINLQAILNLPKGTEHFMSDLHGEHEAFIHIKNSASGAVRKKVDALYENTLAKDERAQLATLIYYPKEKLAEMRDSIADLNEWYKLTLYRLFDICRLSSSKYTRSKVRKALPPEYAYIIDELINTNYEVTNKRDYYDHIIATIIKIDCAEDFIKALCLLIKRLVVDRLHIVGDIFDRGPRADIVMDLLMEHHCVDIQWGNHDVLWMGAAAGSRTCIATVLSNSIIYNNLEVIETGYGISLRPLALFAEEIYADSDTACFKTRTTHTTTAHKVGDAAMAARMHKAIAIIMFKLEGQTIRRNPCFKMDDRLLLENIDYARGVIRLDGVEYPLKDADFPTINPEDPYALSPEEAEVMQHLKTAFSSSEKLQRHVRFLYVKGGIYKRINGNLLFHGSIPMEADGRFMSFTLAQKTVSGKAFLDHAEAIARQGYFAKEGTHERQRGKDFLWFLWCGRNSPLFGRDHITTLERRLIEDETTWAEPKNAYYDYNDDPAACTRILNEFGLYGEHCHIINGHIPVKTKDGETPVKAGGKLIVIDGGFCRAYQKTTGIAGYTLIYDSWGISLAAHEPFVGLKDAMAANKDIVSTEVVFDRVEARIRIKETELGHEIRETVDDLMLLLAAYREGVIREDARAALKE